MIIYHMSIDCIERYEPNLKTSKYIIPFSIIRLTYKRENNTEMHPQQKYDSRPLYAWGTS